MTAPVQRPALVFDGDCGFCTRSADVARRVLPAGCAVVPWQEVDLAAVGATAARAQQEVLWVPRTGEVVGGAHAVAAALRAADPPVVGRISDGRVLLDPRTLTDAEVELVAWPPG